MFTRPLPFNPATALQDLARTLLVWQLRDWPRTTPTALRQWVHGTAAWGPRAANASSGISLLERLHLVSDDKSGGIVACKQLTTLAADAERGVDEFSPGIRLEILHRILEDPELGEELRHVFAFFRHGRGRPSVQWSGVRAADRTAVGWLWLQQLGLAQHEDADFVADPVLAPLVLDSLPTGHKLSQADLDVRLRLQREQAELAEQYVVQLEVERLRSLGSLDLAEGVVRVSVEDVNAGFDVRSFEISGAPRFIEVKSSAGPRRMFFISRNELRVAREKGAAYWIAWVGWSARLPDSPPTVTWFREAVRMFDDARSPWKVDAVTYEVEMVSGDEEWSTPP